MVTAAYDPDRGRLIDRFGALCDLAAPFGLTIDIEFFPWTDVPNLSQAAAVVAAVDRTNSGILVDALLSDEALIDAMLRFESALAATQADLGIIPPKRQDPSLETAAQCNSSMLTTSSTPLSAIGNLVLSNTAAKIGTQAKYDRRVREVTEAGMSAVVDEVLEGWFSNRFRRMQPSIVASLADALKRTSPEGYIGCCQAIRDADLSKDVERIKAPTLIIAGTEDQATPLAASQFLNQKIPASQLVALESGIHRSR